MKSFLSLFIALMMLISLTSCKKVRPEVPKELIDNYTRNTEEDPDAILPLSGKTVVCMGDSLFGLHRDATSTPSVIADTTGAAVYNVGFGGSRISYHPYEGYEAFSGYLLADAVVTGDWSLQDAQVLQGDDYFPDQLNTLKSIDFSTVDILVLHYGTNDFNGKYVPFDNPDDPKDTSTICGALNYTVNRFKEAYPELEIVVSLPIYRVWDIDSETPDYAETRTDSFGNTLTDLIGAMKSCADANSVATIDAYHSIGINKNNATEYLADGTHLNDEGRRLFGEYIGECLIDICSGEDEKVTDESQPADSSAVDTTSSPESEAVSDTTVTT